MGNIYPATFVILKCCLANDVNKINKFKQVYIFSDQFSTVDRGILFDLLQPFKTKSNKHGQH